MTIARDNFDSQADFDEYVAAMNTVDPDWGDYIEALHAGVPRKQAWKERFNGMCAGDYSKEETAFDAQTEHARRKARPLYTGFLVYFPDAIGKVAELSLIANEQHHPGTPLHWDKSKSQDHNDCIIRHMIDDVKGIKIDDDDVWHKTKVAWRAMAELQEECDREAAQGTS